ncbi:MAG: manganese efflux pump [Ruminococcaceae bacterium]|nr:manganese efflux pump [Oscillospiraceae bacterium]
MKIFMFLFNSILLGVGLAMDAFSVSLANGLNEPCMKRRKMCGVAGVFSFFQFAMPMLGWICVHTISKTFNAFEKYIPWIAFSLLLFIGGKMLVEGFRTKASACTESAVGFGALLVQGVATSIDALSVGFTISEHTASEAFSCCLLIAFVTFFICMTGILLGKKFGTKMAGKASVLGGAILIAIGVEILITGVFL